MFHIQILAGLLAGAVWTLMYDGRDFCLLFYFGRILAVCALFYGLFLLRMLGAGDIKLMALCVGIAGFEAGLMILLFGFLPAAACAYIRMRRQGTLSSRILRLTEFVLRAVTERKFTAYPGREEKQGLLRMGPFLFAGCCVYLAGKETGWV